MILLSIITETERAKLNIFLVLVAKGDEHSLSSIYELVGGRLMSVAMGYLRNVQLAEDVLHDSFINIALHANTYRQDTNGYAWLCKIVRNTALNKIKSENIRRGEDIDSILDITDGRDLYNDSITSIQVKDAMKYLSGREKTIIWLKYYNDMTVRQIANEIGMTKSTVQDIIKRAETILKEKLK